ncbi:MAG: sortase [Bacilli bacterium]|nr:sortase [Bacilli bacterium]
MLKKIFILFFCIITIVFFLSLIKIDSKVSTTINTSMLIKKGIPNYITIEKNIGLLEIPKIGLKQKLYKLNSSKNNIEENVTILKDSYPNFLVLAAHSGTGSIAYFNNLNQLEINDSIILSYYEDHNIYEVKEINRTKKNGSIRIHKNNENTLVLTTCDPENSELQIIISCIKKESY